jgi:hypothetical protein
VALKATTIKHVVQVTFRGQNTNFQTGVKVDDNTTVSEVKRAISDFFQVDEADFNIVWCGKVLDHEGFRTVVGEYDIPAAQGRGGPNVLAVVIAKGGGKRARDSSSKGGDLDKNEVLSKCIRNIKSQVATIVADANLANDEMVTNYITLINDFLMQIDKTPSVFNDMVKKLHVDRLMEVSQIVGEKNWEHRVRHITKAVWHEQLTAITNRIELLTIFRQSLFRDVTTVGYYAANMNQSAVCDHTNFGIMVATAIGERAFAAGRASAAGASGNGQ